MQDLPTEWTALCLLVLMLGMKHGMDADHLAAIDALTRFNARQQRPFARYCGALFSGGHGIVVILIAVTVGAARSRWQAPHWLELTGAWISIGFLAGLGLVNLRAVLAPSNGAVLMPVGVKGRLLGRLLGRSVGRVMHASRPGSVALVGSLFAISYDTVSQAALFAVAASHFGGVGHAVVLGLLFVAGMLLTDGINGLWVSRLIARADRVAAIASRVMTGAVACASLLIAAVGIGRLALPAFDAWSDANEVWFGLAVVALIASSYAAARWLAQTPMNAAQAAAPDR